MRILWITPQLPCLNSGAQVRQYHLLRYLSKWHEIRLVSLVQPAEESLVPEIESWGIKVYPVGFTSPEPRSGWKNRMESWVQLIFDPKPKYGRTYPLHGLESMVVQVCEDWQPDLCNLEHLFLAPLSVSLGNIPWVLATHNIESENIRSRAKNRVKLTHRLAGLIEYQKLKKWEKYWISQAIGCIAVSEADAAIIRSWGLAKDVIVAQNGADTKWFDYSVNDHQDRSGLLFFGSLGYYPNDDALRYFLQDILPLIRKRFPDISMKVIGGKASEDIVISLKQAEVDYLGFVPDIRPFLKATQVCVVPLRSGGGTRLKILEAMAAGLPVVSTTKGAEGLDVEHHQHILIADTPKEFSDCVEILLTDQTYANDLRQNARSLVEISYDWEGIAKNLSVQYMMMASSFSTSLRDSH